MLKVSLGMSVREFTIVVREQLGERMKSKLVMFFAAMLIPFSLLSMALSENLNDLLVFYDQIGLLMILAPLLGCAYFLNKANGQHWQETFLALGVPLSLIAAYQSAIVL